MTSVATLQGMRTLLPDPPPAEWAELLERRRRLGLDHHDEVWEGVLHIMPSPTGEHATVGAQVMRLLGPHADAAQLTASNDFNLGDSQENFRVPDGGLHRTPPRGAWITTAALAIEILSKGDETWEKLPFYASHHVEELLIVDPEQHKVDWLKLSGGEYRHIERSPLIDLGADELSRQIDWP